jgi:hypothetical protein
MLDFLRKFFKIRRKFKFWLMVDLTVLKYVPLILKQRTQVHFLSFAGSMQPLFLQKRKMVMFTCMTSTLKTMKNLSS